MREVWAGSVLEATLERITYANAETGYTVARVDPGRGGELVTVVGALLGAQPGETLRLRGRWGAHPQYGRQFQVEDYATVLPATAGADRLWRPSRRKRAGCGVAYASVAIDAGSRSVSLGVEPRPRTAMAEQTRSPSRSCTPQRRA